MALNPTLCPSTVNGKSVLSPLPMRDEYFVMFREGVEFVVTTKDDTYKGKGHVHLTSHRLVFVREGEVAKHKKFTSIEIPHFLVHGSRDGCGPEFHQPIFGCNNLESDFAKLEVAKYPIKGNFRLYFKHGQCESFVRAYHQIWTAAQRSAVRAGFHCSIIRQMHAGDGTVAVDPNDPSVVYLAQPRVEETSPMKYT